MAEEAEEKIPTDSPSENEQAGEDTEDKQKYRQETIKQPKCNLRIEELAKPRTILVSAVYEEYKHVLPKPNALLVKQYLEEEYAKTTEDITNYFAQLKSAHAEKKKNKLSKQKAKRKDKETYERRKRQEIICKLKELMKKALFNAYMNPKQIIMTSVIRRISDNVLTKLCELRRIEVPDREDTSMKAELMCTISDWLAYYVDYIYYEVQVRKVHDYEELMTQLQEERNLKDKATPEIA